MVNKSSLKTKLKAKALIHEILKEIKLILRYIYVAQMECHKD